MKHNDELSFIPLFSGIEKQEIDKILSCSNATKLYFKKDEFIVNPGGSFNKIGIVLSGNVVISRTDLLGNCIVLSSVSKGELFGFSASMSNNFSDTYIYAGDDCSILVLNKDKILLACSANCNSHRQILLNIISLLSDKNLSLIKKIGHISQHSLRRKIISYLSEEATQNGQNQFYISFNRQEMADYLATDRSALSAELSRMKKDGLIEYNKNYFELKSKLINNNEL